MRAHNHDGDERSDKHFAAASRSLLPALHAVEASLVLLTRAARILPAITAQNASVERVRLRVALEAGEMPEPRFDYPLPKRDLPSVRFIDRIRRDTRGLPGEQLYADKLDELELDLALLSALGDGRRVRPLAARRFGTGNELVPTPQGQQHLCDFARGLLAVAPPGEEPRTVPAHAPDDEPSLSSLIESLAMQVGITVIVRVEPNLAAAAATGDRTVYIADRSFGVRESWRLAVHEVFGHLTSAANGRQQALRIVEWGTAGSFADQEGVALCLEEEFGLLDAGRLRSLGGRVLATAAMHDGASFGETARVLHREHGFTAGESITLCERAHRGGGVARDAGYLIGYLRVREALDAGTATLDDLRIGRVGVSALPLLRELIDAGLAQSAVYRPNFSRNFCSTSSGTMPWRSPPRAAASLMSVELT